MSFSGKVKEELINIMPRSRHCQIAEAAAVVCLEGKIRLDEEGKHLLEILICTENEKLIKKEKALLCSLLKEFNQDYTNEGNSYVLSIQGETADKLLSMMKIDKNHMAAIERGARGQRSSGGFYKATRISSRILANTCCKRAFLRGVFLCAGSLTNPEKKYHFELALPDMEKAAQMQELLNVFSMDAKIVPRKRQFVVYVKEAERISDILNLMGAHISLMDMENIRILKEFRNNINRQVNCETANLNKTVVAAAKKTEDIIYIRDKVGLSYLEPGLKEIASLRIEHPEASLKELGEMLSEPLGKSGVNHRLRKLSQIADRLRK